jgi:hypothetical protein
MLKIGSLLNEAKALVEHGEAAVAAATHVVAPGMQRRPGRRSA